MLVVGVVYGRDRAREGPRGRRKRKNGRRDLRRREDASLSRTADARRARLRREQNGGGGKGIKKKELEKDFKLVYNDVEMRTIID